MQDNCLAYRLCRLQGGSVGLAKVLLAGRLGGSKPRRSKKFFSSPNRPEGTWAPPYLPFNIYFLIPRGQSGRNVNLSTYCFLVPDLRISGVISPLPNTFHGDNMENLPFMVAVSIVRYMNSHHVTWLL